MRNNKKIELFDLILSLPLMLTSTQRNELYGRFLSGRGGGGV